MLDKLFTPVRPSESQTLMAVGSYYGFGKGVFWYGGTWTILGYAPHLYLGMNTAPM